MNKRKIGSDYEQMAADYLAKRGYTILEQNHRNKCGEIDIIASSAENDLIFCEVKYRATYSCGDPLEAVDYRKQCRISRTALCYYARHHYPLDTSCRFDVIAIDGDGNIRHIENAFEYRG